MKIYSLFSTCLALPGTVSAIYNSSGPVTYLGKQEALWSDGAAAHGWVFTGGVLGGINGTIVEGGIKNQTAQALRNMAAVFHEGGTSWSHVVKVNIFLADIADWPAMNEVYVDMVPFPKPGRTAIQAAKLSGEFLVEIEGIAAVPYY